MDVFRLYCLLKVGKDKLRKRNFQQFAFLGNPQLQSVASRKGVILLSCIFVGFILLLLYREIFVHLSIIYRREKYSAGSSVRNVIEPKDLGMQSDCDDACNWDDKENNYD